MKSFRTLAIAALLMSVAPLLRAQGEGGGEDEVDVQELIRQIRRNMVEVEKEIDLAEAQAGQKAGQQAEKDIQKLVDSMKGRGQQITSDIDAIIKNMKC